MYDKDPKHVYKCQGEKKLSPKANQGKNNCNNTLVLTTLTSMGTL